MPKSNHYILKYGDWKFGQGNASVRTLHQPPIRISNPKEKRKCISASARTDFIFYFLFFSCIRTDGTSIRMDGNLFIYLFIFHIPADAFTCLCGRDQYHRR
jgi:hypothetical protein